VVVKKGEVVEAKLSGDSAHRGETGLRERYAII